MATPGGLVDKTELINAQLDTAHLGRVVNSKDASGNPIDTSTNRTGGVNKTLDALETEYLEAIQGAGGISIGTWTAGVTTFNAYNEYAVYNGIPYKPRTSTVLPYVAQGVDPTVAPDDANVQPYQEITEAQVVAVVEETIPDELPKYTNLAFDSVSVAVSEIVSKDYPIGSKLTVDDYHGGTNPNNSGVLFFKIVAAGTGTPDGGKYIDIDGTRQLEQNMSNPIRVKAYGAIYDYFLENGAVNPSPTSIHAEFQAAIDYAEENDIGEVHLGDGFAYMSQGVEHGGNIKISGVDSNNSATIIYSDLVGLPVIKAVKSGSEGLFYKPRYQNFKINGLGSGVNRPIAVELRLCSEFEFDHFYVENCTDAVLLDNAAIGFYERFDAIRCARVFTFKSTLATTPNNNSFHEISNCNIFDISEAIFSFESGACDNITMRDAWIESFNVIIQAPGAANDYPVSLRKLSIVNSKISDTSKSLYTSRLINALGEPSSRLTQFLKIKFEDCEIETTNTSDMVRIDDNSNSNPGSLFFEDLIFEDCELFGAKDQVISSTSTTTTASFRGRTTAREGFFSGAATPWTLGTNVTLLDTPLTSYGVIWTATTTNPTIGNGALVGRYQVINGVCNVEIELNIGSTTDLGVGAWSFGLPINHINGFGRAVGSSAMLESGVQFFLGSPFVEQGASTVQVVTNESGTFIGPSNPFAWGGGDRVTVSFDYPVINPIT